MMPQPIPPLSPDNLSDDDKHIIKTEYPIRLDMGDITYDGDVTCPESFCPCVPIRLYYAGHETSDHPPAGLSPKYSIDVFLFRITEQQLASLYYFQDCRRAKEDLVDLLRTEVNDIPTKPR